MSVPCINAESARSRWNLLKPIRLYGEMIKFSHSVFALPFALSAAILAHRQTPLTWRVVGWIILAMVAARSAAMGFNRIVDAPLDACNPRTNGRAIPSGSLSMTSAIVFVLFSATVFVGSAAMISRLCFVWSFPVLGILLAYSLTKRLTVFCHIFLGFSIALVPPAVWVAVTGSFSARILLLSGALMTYIAGFDILYACQDIDFDRNAGLYSIPARYGPRRALQIAALLHMLSFGFLIWIHFAFDMNLMYAACVVLVGLLLILEHRLVRPDDLSRIRIAFFHINSLISITLLAGVALDRFIGGPL